MRKLLLCLVFVLSCGGVPEELPGELKIAGLDCVIDNVSTIGSGFNVRYDCNGLVKSYNVPNVIDIGRNRDCALEHFFVTFKRTHMKFHC